MAKQGNNKGGGKAGNVNENVAKARMGVQMKKTRRKAAMKPVEGRFDVNAFYTEKKEKMNQAGLSYIKARWTFISPALQGEPQLIRVWLTRQKDIYGHNPLVLAWVNEIEQTLS